MAAQKRTIPGLEDTKKQIAHDAAARAARIREKCDQLQSDARHACAMIEPLDVNSSDDTIQDAAEAVAGASLRIVTLALECAHEAGLMIAESALRARLNEL